jgi:hypothetical protein
VGAVFITVTIDLLSWRSRRAEAAAQALSKAFGEIGHLKFQVQHSRHNADPLGDEYRKDIPRVLLYNYLHGPNHEIAAAIRAVAARYPKVRIKASQVTDSVVLAGEIGEDDQENRDLLRILGERIL